MRRTVKEPALHLFIHFRQHNYCERDHAYTNPLSIIKLLHEARVLTDTRDVERLCLSTNGVDEVVVLHRGAAYEALNFGRVFECNGLVGWVDVGRGSFNDGHAAFLVTGHIPGGLNDRSWAQRAGSDTGQERREKEVIAGANNELERYIVTRLRDKLVT